MVTICLIMVSKGLWVLEMVGNIYRKAYVIGKPKETKAGII